MTLPCADARVTRPVPRIPKVESTGGRGALYRLLPHPVVLGLWLVSLVAVSLLAVSWAFHPSHVRSEWAIDLAALTVVGTVVLGATFTGPMRFLRFGMVLVAGSGVLLAEYAVAYAVSVPNAGPGDDNAAAVGAVFLSASVFVLLGTLLGLGVGLRAGADRLIRARRKPPPRPDLVTVEGLR